MDNIIINGKNFYDQAIDSSIERYEKIRKLTTGQSEYYITGRLLHYEFIANLYKLISINFSR